ncbi:MAG: FISUMP domain-containing protein [Candidatus Zixiibacteriota bacterium]
MKLTAHRKIILALTVLTLFSITTSGGAADSGPKSGWSAQAADGCCVGRRGNVDGTGIIDLVDLSSLVNYLQGGGFLPPCLDAANVNGVGIIDLADLSSLVNYLTTGQYIPPDCPTNAVTDIDGNVYQTVTIGTQVWMGSNLKVTHYRNGDSISNVSSAGVWAGLGTGAYCDYGNDSANVATYGRLYNWFAATDIRNIAPVGWHVPSDSEYMVLEMYLGMSQSEADAQNWRGSTEGGKLKESGFAHWPNPNTGATNSSGFTALPAGFRGYDGDFNGSLHVYAYFWGNTGFDQFDPGSAYGRELGLGYAQINRGGFVKQNGFSIRCVKD